MSERVLSSFHTLSHLALLWMLLVEVVSSAGEVVGWTDCIGDLFTDVHEHEENGPEKKKLA